MRTWSWTTSGAQYWLPAATGMLLVVFTFYPGLMNGDAIVQLTEARSGVFYDWQPPLIGHLWALFDAVAPGPFGMLMLQNATFWLGLAVIAYAVHAQPARSAALILAVGLYPPVLSSLGAIWKDVMLGSALLLSFGLLLTAQRHRSGRALILGSLGLFYGLSVRHNAAPAVLPFALWAAALLVRRRWPAWSNRRVVFGTLALGVTFCGAMYVAAAAEDRALASGGQLYPAQQILVHDLVAISIRSAQPGLLDGVPAVGGPPSLDQLRCLYTPDSAIAVFGGVGNSACDLRFERLTDARAVDALGHIWLAAVWAHPGAYVAHRLEVFTHEFSMSADRVCYPLQASTDANTLGVNSPATPLSAPALTAFALLAYDTPLYAGWPYVVLAALLLVVVVRQRRDRMPRLVLGSSGLLYALGYLAVGTTCDFRMHWWTVVSVMVLAVVMLVDRRPTAT